MINYQLVKGSTNVSVTIRIIDSTDGTPETGVVFNTAGIDMEYRREGAASVDITEATLAALTTAHTDGGFLEIGNGYYRLDVPDAAFATGADGVLVHGTVTGMVVIGAYVQLTDIDIMDGVRGGMTALPNAAADAAGGLPISDAGGLDLDGMNTNINDIETDTADMQPKLGTITDLGGGTTLGDNLSDIAGSTFNTSTDSNEAIRNRGDAEWITGAGGSPPDLLQNTTIATLASQTSFTLTAGSADDDAYNGAMVVVTDSATSTQKATGWISDYTGSTKTVTLKYDPGIFTMAVGDTIDIIAYEGVKTDSANDHFIKLTTAGAVDVASFLSNGVTISTAGLLEVDVEEIGDSAQSLVDLKDFVDAGYDPATNKVQGVVLVDTITTYTGNTVQTGDAFARLGAPAGASVSADILVVDTNVDTLITRVPDTLSLANINAEVDTAFTTQMADSVSTDGAIATREQALYMTLQFLTDFAISGTTVTVNKVDGTTPLMTFTLDSSTTPTSITRAT